MNLEKQIPRDYTMTKPMTADMQIALQRLGAKIRSRRKKRALPVAELATAARTSASHLFGIERGERSASLLCLVRIAEALGTTVEELCEGIDDPRVGIARQ